MAWGVGEEKDQLGRLGMYGAFFSIPRGETDTTRRRCFHTEGRRLIMLRPDVQGGRTTAFLTVLNDNDSRFGEVAADGYDNRQISKGRMVLLGDAAYCSSPMSGMGTTLAMHGAYSLARALTRYPDNLGVAFGEYEDKMRPSVDRAQNLRPVKFRIMNPETAWGVWLVDTTISIIVRSRPLNLLMMLKKPENNTVLIEDYGLKELPEWREYGNDGSKLNSCYLPITAYFTEVYI